MAEKYYTHSGDDGDVIYFLASLRKMGGGHVRLTPSANLVREAYSPSKAERMAALLRAQPYVLSCEYCPPGERDAILREGGVNADGWRGQYKGGPNIIDWQADYLGCWPADRTPWLTVPSPLAVAPAIIHRSFRYRHDYAVPWWDVPSGFRGRVAMVGSPAEYEEFCGRYGWVPYHPTADFLELARVIAGAKLFVGNQSAPMACALGLGVAVVQEVCPGTPNCRLPGRDNAQYIGHYSEVRWPDV